MATPMTNQQVFDTVVAHLAKQGRRAIAPLFMSTDARSLLIRLQGVHDICSNWNSASNMQRELRRVARDYGLDDSIVDRTDFSHVHP